MLMQQGPLLEGKSLSQAIKYAHAAGALSVTKAGAQTSVPTRTEVDNFIQLHNQ
jgi:Sugar kinases, ribokinase family